MGDGNGLGKIGIAFLVVMGISAAAAVPFLTHPKPAAAPPVIEAPPEPEPEPEPIKEEPPEPAPKAAKPKAKKTTSTWNGGGDTRAETSAVGRNGKTWNCPRCKREWGSAGVPPAFVQCCGVSYFNGKAKSYATPNAGKK